MITRKYRIIIGRNEPVLLVAHNKQIQFPAKVDTGAYRSAIHCTDMKIVERKGVKILKGTLLAGHPCAFNESYAFETNDFNRVTVFNSFGGRERRYVITIRYKIGPLIFNTTVTLADRSKKLFPILLGRQALRRRFYVDASVSNIDRKLLKERYGVDMSNDGEDYNSEE